MSRRKSRRQPIPISGQPQGLQTPDLLVLDRFSAESLERWQERSGDLDELHQLLYFGLEPERQRRRSELIAALSSMPADPVDLDGWVRILDHAYTLQPLSCAGSLKSIGGRFNIGCDVEHRMGDVFPALYIASDYETAYREKYQCAVRTMLGGLTPQELALNVSNSTVRLRGRVQRVFDVSDLSALEPVTRILATLKMPPEASRILERLGEPRDAVVMIRNARQMRTALQDQNWRTWPTQFDIPSPSQQIGALIRSAGYEAILYDSSKGSGKCLCVFPENIETSDMFVELADAYPREVKHPRLDLDTAVELGGWHAARDRDRRKG